MNEINLVDLMKDGVLALPTCFAFSLQCVSNTTAKFQFVCAFKFVFLSAEIYDCVCECGWNYKALYIYAY